MRSALSRLWESIRTLHHPSNAVLLQYFDRELEPVRHAVVHQHVQHCAVCAARIDRFQQGLKTFENISRSSDFGFSVEDGLKKLVVAMNAEGPAVAETVESAAAQAVHARLLSELSIYLGRHAATQLLEKCSHSSLQRDRLDETVGPTIRAFLGERTASVILANVVRIWDRTYPAAT